MNLEGREKSTNIEDRRGEPLPIEYILDKMEQDLRRQRETWDQPVAPVPMPRPQEGVPYPEPYGARPNIDDIEMEKMLMGSERIPYQNVNMIDPILEDWLADMLVGPIMPYNQLKYNR